MDSFGLPFMENGKEEAFRYTSKEEYVSIFL